MVNYKNGKIYMILDNTNGNYYIGSTAQHRLNDRIKVHKHKAYTNQYSSSIIINNNDYNVILLEEFPCNNKQELFHREKTYTQNNTDEKLVNKQSPIRTREEILKKNIEYNNSEKGRASKKKYRVKVECDNCKRWVYIDGIPRHKQTAICKSKTK